MFRLHSDRRSDLSPGRFGAEVEGRHGLQRRELRHRVRRYGGTSVFPRGLFVDPEGNSGLPTH